MKSAVKKDLNYLNRFIVMKIVVLFLLLSGSVLQAASCPDYKRVFENKAIMSTGVWIDADATIAIDSATAMAIKGIPLQAIDFLKTEHTTLYNDNIHRMIMSKASEIIHGYKILSKEWDANTSIAEVIVQQDGQVFSKEICSEIASNPNPSETVSEVTAAETATEVSTTAAATSGLSSTTLWVAGGVALAAGAGVAIAAGGSSGGDGGGGTAPGEIIDNETQYTSLVGDWIVDYRHNNGQTADNVEQTLKSDKTFTYAGDNGLGDYVTYRGIWDLENGYMTLIFDAGANYGGEAVGSTESFCVASNNGWTGCYTRR